jgi:hypothetical protein
MGKKFRTSTLFLGVLTGASTIAMISNNKPFTYVSGTVSIAAFIVAVVIDIRIVNL